MICSIQSSYHVGYENGIQASPLIIAVAEVRAHHPRGGAPWHWAAQHNIRPDARTSGLPVSQQHPSYLSYQVYLALFQTTSAVVPIDPAGLYHFSSSSESDVMMRLLSMPSKLGHELLSI